MAILLLPFRMLAQQTQVLTRAQLDRVAAVIDNHRLLVLGDSTKIDFCAARTLWNQDTLIGPYSIKVRARYRNKRDCPSFGETRPGAAGGVLIDSVVIRGDTVVAFGRTIRHGGTLTIHEQYLTFPYGAFHQYQYRVTAIGQHHR